MDTQVFIIFFILSNFFKAWGIVLDETEVMKPVLDETEVMEPVLDETEVLEPDIDTNLLEFQNQLSNLDFERFGSYCSPQLIQESFENTNEDVNLNAFEIMTKYGLPFEVFTVQSGSGYNLKLVRIPGDGPAVFVNHGLLSSFVDFLTPGTVSGLGYVLHKAGYDVWFINCRGNKFSKSHAFLSPKDPKFWCFSWHEIGTEDLPKSIDFVLAKTGKKKLIYIGYSQGTTSALVLLSKFKKYNEILQPVILLSPIAFFRNARSPFVKAIAPYHDQIDFLFSVLGQDELLPNDGFLAILKNIICKPAIPLCNNIFLLIKGFNCAQLNYTALPVEVSKIPAGASFRQLVHYLQLIASDKFQEYDYGKDENLKKYGSVAPPDYELANIDAPVAIFRANNDLLSDPRDVQRLADQLSNVVVNYLVPYDEFDHLDFIWAKDVVELLYNKVLEVMQDYPN